MKFYHEEKTEQCNFKACGHCAQNAERLMRHSSESQFNDNGGGNGFGEGSSGASIVVGPYSPPKNTLV